MRQVKITEKNDVVSIDDKIVCCPMTYPLMVQNKNQVFGCHSDCAWFRIDNYYIDSNMKAAYCGDHLIGEVKE